FTDDAYPAADSSNIPDNPAAVRHSRHTKARPSGRAFFRSLVPWSLLLHAERRSAAAGALHLGILKLEPRRLKSLDVVDNAPIQVHERGPIEKHRQVVTPEDLVHHAGLVLKRH